MKTYLLTFFILTNCLMSSIFGQDFSEIETDQKATYDQQQNENQSTIPINPNDPFGDLEERTEKAPDDFQAKFINMLVVLGLLIGFMILASWMLKRMMRNRLSQLNHASSIKILETRYLSARSTIYLLDVMGQGLLIGESPTGISHLATLPLDEKEDERRPVFPPVKS